MVRSRLMAYRVLRWWGTVLLGLWMALAGSATHAAEPARIMLLASYHAGFSWSDDQIAAVKSQLQPMASVVSLHVDFLDTKHVRPTPEYYQRLEALLLSKYGSKPPKLILVMDDDALDFALGVRKHLFPGIPILFSGIAASRRAELLRQGNLAGVFDDVDVTQTLATMLALRPSTRRLVVIHDQSRTALAQVESVRQVVIQHPSLQVQYLTDMDVPTIQTQLRGLDSKSLVFQLAFNRDAKDRILSHEEAADLWAAASAAPVAVTRDVSMRPGILGGQVITGRQQGETLGRLAVRALLNEPVSELGMHAGIAVPTFDYTQLQRWGIAEARLPSNAVVLHRPDSAWVALRPHMPWLITLFGGLLIIIGLLVYGIRVRQRSEEELRRSTQNYMELFNSSSDCIVVRDATTGMIVQTNARFTSMYGFDAFEIPTLTAGSLSLNESPYSEKEGRQWVEKTRREGPQCFEWRSRRKDGSLFWSEVSMSRFHLPDGQRIVSMVRDISDRKLVETQAREFAFHVNQIYQNLPVAVFAMDAQHKLTFWNTQMALISGVAAQEVIGTRDSWRALYSTPRPCLADLVVDGLPVLELQRLYANQLQVSTIVSDAVEGEGYFASVNQGQGMWLRYCAAPLRNAKGDLVGAIETVVDVTALKRAQQTLKELNLQLEDRVTERTRELEQTMDQLVQSRKMAALGSLVVGVAHELNTPLGVTVTVASSLSEQLRQFNDVLQSGNARRSEVNAKVMGMLDAGLLIEKNVARAARLVEQFKQVAVARDDAIVESVDVTQLVRHIATGMAPRFLSQTHTIQVEDAPPFRINTYPKLLEQVLAQLISNALNHAFEQQQGGRVTLSLQQDPATQDVTVVCTDNGCGIAPDHLTRLFEPFFTTKLGQGGSGLGLYLAYSLASGILGGDLTAMNNPQGGASFTLRLPHSCLRADA